VPSQHNQRADQGTDTDRRTGRPRRTVGASAARPARHRALGRGQRNPDARPALRARYLLCGLLMLLALIGGSLYLSRGASSAASPSSHGAVTAPQTADACGSARGEGACAQRGPAGISTATAPPDRTTQPAARPRTSASPPSSQAASKPAASASAPVSPGASPSTSANPPATPATPGASAGQVLALINAARSAAGLPTLTITSGLEATASAHNLPMASGCGLSHQCPGEPAIGARETAAGIHWTAAGENIGEGGPVADTTAAITQMAVTLTQDMLNEQPPNDGHRRNILSTSFNHIGIAVYRDSSGTVWLTQDFSN
jgi:uncharacterized protein YkwD